MNESLIQQMWMLMTIAIVIQLHSVWLWIVHDDLHIFALDVDEKLDLLKKDIDVVHMHTHSNNEIDEIHQKMQLVVVIEIDDIEQTQIESLDIIVELDDENENSIDVALVEIIVKYVIYERIEFDIIDEIDEIDFNIEIIIGMLLLDDDDDDDFILETDEIDEMLIMVVVVLQII